MTKTFKVIEYEKDIVVSASDDEEDHEPRIVGNF